MQRQAGHPVHDLAGFLLGGWRLTRLGWNGGSSPAMRLRGTAHCSVQPDGLRFEERGAMAFGGYRGEATRRSLFRVIDGGAVEVYFEDGAPFHCVNLNHGVAYVRHDCAADRYEGRYRVLGPDRWTLGWRVTGPRKRQLIASLFVRSNLAA